MGLASWPTYDHFRSFLRAEGCEEAFDNAFYRFNAFTALDEQLWEAGEPEYVLCHAFDWAATPEGREYWREIDHRWGRFNNPK